LIGEEGLYLKKLAHEPDQLMNELETLRKSQQINQLIIDNAHDLIDQLKEQLQAKNTEQQLAETKLKASEERFRTLVENAPVGIDIHRKGINIFVNQVYVTMHGYESDSELIGNPVGNLLAPESRRSIVERIKKREKGEAEPGAYETVGLRKDGSTFPLFVQATNLLLPDGLANVAFLTDISERKQIEEQLLESEERYRTIFENTGTAMIIFEEDMTISLTNTEAEKLSGYSREEVEGKKRWTEFIAQDDLERMKEYHRGRIIDPASVPNVYEYKHITKQSAVRNISAVIAMVPGTKKRVASLLDITERKQAENELVKANAGLVNEIELRKMAQNEIESLAYYDHLTGLPNRLLLLNNLNQAIALARRIEKPIGIMYMDLDDFKAINDTMGHQQGDELLKAVAHRLVNILRKSDTVTRMSGDEFIIMVPNLGTVDHIEKVAAKVIAAFREPFELIQQEVYVTASIGIAIFPTDGQTGDELIKNADVAMYKAKDQGKNQYVLCTPIMKEIVAENMKLSNGLYRALEKNELEIYYQPQVCVSTNKIIGLEALLRWNHPEFGMVPPGKFIGLAEHTGLIIPIGEWVIRTVCRQSKTWQEKGIAHIKIAVNMSLVQFLNPKIAGQIRGILEETNLSPQYLELEITESIAMRDTEHIINVLNEFREIGMYVSIDDFGTDYSSLRYLKLLPINRIKIPMPFIQGIGVNKKDEAIIKAIIVLARNMGMDIIAEGVETQQQKEFLTKRSCDVIQGYYCYRPMPVREIEALLKNN
jgi:diguanylate cyclase (GGDEF)-like protein/PAS domain S-box-containing protein